MTWAGALALVVVVAILLVPGATTARLGSLARGGRLQLPAGSRPERPGPLVRLGQGVPVRIVLAAAAAGCLALAVTVGVAVGVEAIVVLGVAGLLGRDVHRGRVASARSAELRAAVGLLESELQAGTPPPAALSAAAAQSVRLARALDGRADVVRALTGSGDADLRRLGVTWRVGEATGMPMADVLATFGSDLRSAVEQQRAVAVAVAGPQASAALLCLLPLLGIGLGAAMGAHPLALLFGTPAGQVLACAGLLLDAAGVLWVRRILRAAQR